MRFTKYFIVCAVFILLGIVYGREMPKLKLWLLDKIQTVATEKSGFEVTAKGIDFTFLPPGIELKKLKLTPQDKTTAQTVAPLSIDTFGVSLSTMALFTGRFEIGRVLISGTQVDLTLSKPADTSDKKQAQEIPWNDFINLPLKKVILKNADISATLPSNNTKITTKGLSLSIEKSTAAAKIEIFSPQTGYEGPSGKTELGLATRIILENQAAELSALKISVGKNFLLGRGVARGEITKLQWTTLNFRVLSHLDFDQILQNLKVIGITDVPRATGEFNFEAIGSVKKNEPLVAAADISGQNLQVEEYKIGGIKSRLKLANHIVTSDQVSVANSAGTIGIKDLSLNLKQDSHFAARIKTESLELETLLANLGLKRPSLHLETSLSTACEGNLAGKFKMTCAGEAGGKNFRVFKAATNKTVVALKEFKILSHFIMENNVMTFPDGTIQIGDSKGTATGMIDFETGFSFNFNTSSLDFKDIPSLADLSYKGSFALEGVTKGNGSIATVHTHALTEDFWFEDYHLGKGSFDLGYDAGHLTFSNLNMGMTETSYTGKINVDLNSSTIKSEIDFPKLNLAELSEALSKVASYHVPIDGNGTAHVTAEGPIALSELTYNLSGQFPSGIAYGESFQNLNVGLHGTNGHAFADSINLKKGDGQLFLSGDVTSQGIASLLVRGQGLHVGDFEHVKSLLSGVDGQLEFQMAIQDKLLDPTLSMKGTISQTTINQEPLEDSDFSLQLLPKTINFKTNLFNNKIKAEVRRPRTKDASSYLSFDTEKWDFSHFLSAVSGSEFKRDYETNLTAHVSLTSDTDSLLESRGEIRVPALYIRHGMYQMRNDKPILVKFNEGLVSVESFAIRGDNTDLKITGTRSKKDNLNFGIIGNMELSLFNFLTPFFKEMRGGINLNAQVAGTGSRPEFLGSALLNKAYFKFKEFPHGFDDVNADILFSQTRIVINKLKSQFAGGEMTGNGTVEVKGFRDVQVDVTGDMNKITLEVPEGVTTKGSGQVKVTGNWFPYLLQGTYNIDSGLYTKNFGDQDSTFAMKRSAFLPKGILQKETSSFELDFNTIFNKGVTVRNNMVDTDVTGELQIKGDPRHVLVKGEVNASPNGKLFFKDTPFNINIGKVKFANPTENNPTIYALASSRVRDWDITLLYQGTLDKFELKLSSSPPLAEKSIISLLALGITDDKLETSKSSADVLALQGYQAGSVILSQTPLVKEVKKKSGVSVRLSQSVDDTRNVISPKFVAEKQWTPKFSTSIGKTFGDRSANDLRAEYKLNRNFSLLGSYEKRDYDQFSLLSTTNTTTTSTVTGTQTPPDVFGINLQYQAEFK